MAGLRVEALHATPDIVATLAELLVATVGAGGSVGSLHPLEPERARSFWHDALAAAARAERVVFGAWEDGVVVGTVTLLLNVPPNQPHRAEIAKMMTRPDRRGRGIATALMDAAEALAVERGRTLLVLDTAEEDGASRLYERLGFVHAGTIPEYALKPLGGLTATKLYYKFARARAATRSS